MKQKINAAIIGYGRMGKLYLKVLEKLNINVISIIDKKNKFKKKNNLFLKDLNNKNIDLAIISTTADFHYFYAKKLIKKKIKYLLIEKPVTTSIKQCVELIKLQKKYKNKICVNHNSVLRKHFIKIKKILNINLFGKITSINYFAGNIGLAMNGIHFFDIFKKLSGNKLNLVCASLDKKLSTNPRGKKFKDTSGIILGKNKNKTRMFADISSDQGHGQLLIVFCEFGYLFFDMFSGIVNFSHRKKRFLKAPKYLYKMPYTNVTKKLKIDNIFNATEIHIKNFLKNKKYFSLKDSLYSLKTLNAVHFSGNKIKFEKINRKFTNKSFPWA